MGSQRDSARGAEHRGQQRMSSKPERGKQFQAGGLFVNLLSGLHNRSTQSTNRNPQCSRLGSFKMEQQIGKKNRLQHGAWILKITNKGVVQLLSQKALLKPPRVPWQLSVIMYN